MPFNTQELNPTSSPTFAGQTLTGEFRSTYNGVGVIPASQATAGFSITGNYNGLGEVDFWSLVNSAGSNQGFTFKQKTAAGTFLDIARFYGDATFAEFDFYLNGTILTNMYATSTEGGVGTGPNLPLLLYTNNGSGALTNASIFGYSPLQWASKVAARTANFAPLGPLTSQQCGIHNTTTGAVATVIATLPSDAGSGWRDTFTVDAAQILRLQCPTSHTIAIGAAVSAAAGKAEASAIGASVTIEKVATNKFVATAATGTWTVT